MFKRKLLILSEIFIHRDLTTNRMTILDFPTRLSPSNMTLNNPADVDFLGIDIGAPVAISFPLIVGFIVKFTRALDSLKWRAL